MKKRLFFILSFLSVIILSSLAQAKVTGQCSNCHTMHNSQGGAPLAFQINAAFTGFDPDESPNPTLLVSSCAGCHSSSGTDTIVDGVPVVFNMSAPVASLAGGNFYDVRSNNANGHNVAGITDADTTFATIPGSTTDYYQLTCAGTSGCHGDRTKAVELAAIKGAHHTEDSVEITGTSVGLSYRFLDGILGTEDSDWEQDNVNTSHNEYQGGTNFPTSGTISSLCKQCHGDFHNSTGVGSSSPWLRHPTDIVLPNDGEYQYYNGGAGGGAAGSYSMIAPVARPDLTSPGNTNEARPGTDIVMCLSCHRAHGSPNFKMIRWDILNDFSTGCGVCHTLKQ